MRARSIILVGLVLDLTLVACDAPAVTAPSALSQLCARKDSFMLAGGGGDLNDQFDILALLLPGGFGGLSINYMFLKDTTLADSLRATADKLLTCPGSVPPGLVIARYAPVRQGDFDWLELHSWWNVLMFSVPATWHSADIDEGRNRLYLEFQTQAEGDAFRPVAVAAGVPSAAMILGVGGIPQAHRSNNRQ